ncbi:MFS transporter [Actinomycetospora sp. TBRC 11914]|uniref:MFS transporter n=1 Tax=Actinomycetospora sp. TBRC 11914 TaxID=2729387 RepID=UPI00145EA274|nr:MFS transporter [Actinomycetospora sp. TBRC 11914]NMO88423.1 MFS transporter [Actinomycetospora sp. TBRC 11914]
MTSPERAAPRPDVETPERAAKRRSATRGAFFAEFVDMFDIYLPTVVLTPALVYFQPAGLDPGTAAILTSLVFVTTLLGRPVGAAVFGALADRVGRRRATITSVSGFGVITLLIALIPGHATIGIASYWLLIVLRFLDGVCLGGGYTGALPLAMEYAPKHRRGLLGGVILAAFPLAYVVITLVAMACFAIFPLAGATSAYAVWGWRVPFVLGAVLAGCLVVYYVRSVAESEVWEAAEAAKAEGTSAGSAARPLLAVLRGPSGRAFLQVFTMMTGFWLTQNLVTLFLPTTVLRQLVGLSNSQVTVVLLVSYVCLVASYIGSGVLGQRVGRRRFFVIAGVAIAVFGSALLGVLVTGKGLPFGVVVVVVCAFSVVVTAPWGVVLPYITERFRTDVRASGFGLGFSVSVVIPSFYAFFVEGLGSVVPYAAASVVLLALGGLLGAAGAAAGPETRDVDFATEAPHE